MVNKPRCDLGTKKLFEILIKSLEDTNNRNIKDHSTIRNLRDSASQSIKVSYIYIYIDNMSSTNKILTKV